MENILYQVLETKILKALSIITSAMMIEKFFIQTNNKTKR